MLGTFFDAIRRYRRVQGYLLLQVMKWLPPGTLVRITKDTNPQDPQQAKQYVLLEEMLRDVDVLEYDVDIDEAPEGPNNKERMAAALTQVIPLFTPEMLTPDVLMEVLRYMPISTEFITKLEEIYAAQANSEEAIRAKQQAEQAQGVATAKEYAEALKTSAETDKIQTETAQIVENPDPKPQVTV